MAHAKQNVALCSILLVWASVCRADNFTEQYRDQQGAAYKTRQHRLLTFNTGDQDKIDIELDFSVPFLSIPIKSGMSNGALANLNIGAVALAGMMAFGAAFVVPATYHFFNTKGTYGDSGFVPGDKAQPNKNGNNYGTQYGNYYGNRYRNDDFLTSSSIWKFVSSIDKTLTEHNIDTTSCVQRAICWTVKDSNKRLTMGQATSTDKIVDGLATNSWIGMLVDGSVFQAAIESGLRGSNCSEEYRQCTIDQETIQRFGKQIMSAVYNRK